MYILYRQGNKLRHERITEIEEIQRAMSLSEDSKDIKPADLIHAKERNELRFGEKGSDGFISR